MKIMLVDVNCKKGSTGKIVYDLALSLQSQGHETLICYGRGSLVKEPGIVRFSSRGEMLFHAFLARTTGLNGYFSPLATKKLFQLIDDFKPDIVHIHDPKTYYLNITSLMDYLKEKDIATIWTLHSEFMYTGKCGYAYGCQRWTQGCGQCPQVGEYPKSLWFDFTQKMLQDKKNSFEKFNNLTLVTPSQWLASRVGKSILCDRDVQVIPNGIETAIFHPRDVIDLRKELSLSADDKIILAVAPHIMEDRKGGMHVLEVARRMKDIPVRFIVIGVAKSEVPGNLPDNILFFEQVNDQDELATYYTLADAFLICSKMENLPTTCLESICCGTPVVGFDVGGVRETTAPYPEFGTFVPYGDVGRLVVSLKELLEAGSSGKRHGCAQAGKAYFSKEVMMKRYLSLYQSALSAKEFID